MSPTAQQVVTESATPGAVDAFAALREGELRGSRWEAYTGTEIRVLKSVWRKHVKPPKTKYSKAPVPIIQVLAKKLNEYRELCGSPTEGWMFPNSEGNPRCLDDMARDVIRPALKKLGIKWHGWHAFRRGLATNLHRLGVPDKEIQRILRHSRISVTQESYIKTSDSEAVSAMSKLEHATNMQLSVTMSTKPGCEVGRPN